MRGKGITFDTGFFSSGTSTREPFDPDVVRREMRVIHDDLHCNVVRVTGGDADRLAIAAKYAADAGLEVWFCPFTNGLTQKEVLDLLADCAERAERIRRPGAEVVMVTGSELILFTTGFLPGEKLEERLALLADPLRLRSMIGDIRARFKEFLRSAVEIVRARFHGRISYASLPLESVDWTLFDIISTDAAYRTKYNEANFRESIRAFVAQGRAQGKPVAITEFGCTTHRGAAHGDGQDPTFAMIAWDEHGRAIGLKGEYVRDEDEQATYLREVLEVFEEEGVDYAFVNTFARYDLPHRSDPGRDLDVASFGVVKVLASESGERNERYADMPWQPKAAFNTLANLYSR